MRFAIRSLQPLLLLALLALALPAGATVARFLPLEEHVAAAQLIVRAKAGSQRTFVSEQDGRPRTDRRFTILETWKGDRKAGEEVVVRQMRGGLDQGEVELRIPGDPELKEGEEVVLFLVTGTEGVAYLAALAQSKYAVTRDRSGAWAQRDFEGLAFTFGDDGRAIASVPESAITLELLEKSVRGHVKK